MTLPVLVFYVLAFPRAPHEISMDESPWEKETSGLENQLPSFAALLGMMDFAACVCDAGT